MKDKDLSKAITGIFDAILADSDDKARDTQLFKFLVNKISWLKDPDEFSTMVIHPFENIIENVGRDHQLAGEYLGT